MRKMGASPAFLPRSSLTAVTAVCSAPPMPRPAQSVSAWSWTWDRWSYFWSTYSDTRLWCPPWLWVDTERELSLPITTAIIIPLRSLENRKWKPYLHLYSAKMMEKIKVGSKPSPLKLAPEGKPDSRAWCFIIQGLADTNVCIMLPALPAPAQDGFLMCCGCWVYLSYLSRYSSSDLCIQGDRGEDDRVMYGLCSQVAPSQPRW